MAQEQNKKWRILAIDDDQKMLQSYKNILSPALTELEVLDSLEEETDSNFLVPDFSFELMKATQGLEGVELVREGVESGSPFSLALVDMRMPPGIDGIETISKIRDIDKDIHIAIVTAHTDHSIASMQRVAGGNVVLLRKPFAADELLQLSRNFCHSWGRDRELEAATERLESEVFLRTKELRKEKEYIEAILRSMSDVLIVADANGYIQTVNDATTALLGYQLDELVGKKVGSLFEEEEEEEEEEVRSSERIMLAKDRRKVLVLLSSSVIYEHGERQKNRVVRGLVLTAKDIRKQKATTEALKISASDLAFQSGQAEMSVSIIHNIGNAITSVSERSQQLNRDKEDICNIAGRIQQRYEEAQLYLDQLAKSEDMPNPVNTFLRLISAVPESLRNIADTKLRNNISDILIGVEHIADIVRIQQATFKVDNDFCEPFSLAKTINDTMALQAASLERHNILFQSEIEVEQVDLPRNQFMQAVGNLIRNAIEAIDLNPELEGSGRIFLTVLPVDNDQLLLIVKDNGCGINSEKLETIFQFGFTDKIHGSGFGLHSVANFIQSIGGSICAKSKGKNQGSSFEIRVPVKIK